MAPIFRNVPQGLSEKLCQRYSEIQKNYNLHNWSACGISAGKFVEDARRIVEYETNVNHKYTPIGKNLPAFNDKTLTGLASENTSIDESWRIIIPRVLYSMYTLRNKHGAAHESMFDMNATDSLYLLHSAKWIICEIARLCADTKEANEVNDFIKKVNTRSAGLIWESKGKICVNNPKIKCPDQVLLLLYSKSVLSVDELLEATEYANKSRFKNILQSMHKDRLLYYDATSQTCELLERGIQIAEKLIEENGNER